MVLLHHTHRKCEQQVVWCVCVGGWGGGVASLWFEVVSRCVRWRFTSLGKVKCGAPVMLHACIHSTAYSAVKTGCKHLTNETCPQLHIVFASKRVEHTSCSILPVHVNTQTVGYGFCRTAAVTGVKLSCHSSNLDEDTRVVNIRNNSSIKNRALWPVPIQN